MSRSERNANKFHEAADTLQIEAMRLAESGVEASQGKALVCATLSAGYRQAGAILDGLANL